MHDRRVLALAVVARLWSCRLRGSLVVVRHYFASTDKDGQLFVACIAFDAGGALADCLWHLPLPLVRATRDRGLLGELEEAFGGSLL